MDTNTIIQGMLDKAEGKVKTSEVDRYVEKNASRAAAIKTTEERKFSHSELTDRLYKDTQAAYTLADA